MASNLVNLLGSTITRLEGERIMFNIEAANLKVKLEGDEDSLNQTLAGMVVTKKFA